MTAVHDHPGADLTVGCPACIHHVREEAWRVAPLRKVTWSWSWRDANNKLQSFRSTAEVRVPDGVDPWEVDERYPDSSVLDAPEGLIDDFLNQGIGAGPDSIHIGPVVQPAETMEQGSLL